MLCSTWLQAESQLQMADKAIAISIEVCICRYPALQVEQYHVTWGQISMLRSSAAEACMAIQGRLPTAAG